MLALTPGQMVPLWLSSPNVFSGMRGTKTASNISSRRGQSRLVKDDSRVLCSESLDQVVLSSTRDGKLSGLAALLADVPKTMTLPPLSALGPRRPRPIELQPWWLVPHSPLGSFHENVSLLSSTSVRSFKSRRHNSDGSTLFNRSATAANSLGWIRQKEAASAPQSSAKTANDAEHKFDPVKILENAEANKNVSLYTKLTHALNQNNLSGDDKRLAAASVHGYAAGIASTGHKESEKNSNAQKTSLFWKRLALFMLSFELFRLIFVRGKNNGVFSSVLSSPFVKEITPEEVQVNFNDVKGCDEAKDELKELVDFLTNPEKFSQLGGKLPKGCLLTGPPGTGKTLLAKAVAGEAGVPFFYSSASEFDEVFVGQGARRIRNLFQTAKQNAPCVIFIDEIDSVGSTRTSSPTNPYANQTINQLLSEMDGFITNEGVIVLAATNRAEHLDKALLRPGRFDTKVQVPLPDVTGRKEILHLYLAKIVHDLTVDVETLAKRTVGFSGADLQNMVNTAAIRAAVENKSAVNMQHFEYSHDKHTLGVDWKSRVRPKYDLEITAYHEAGHVLVAYYTKDATPLHKVTIVAKGMSGGHTAFIPENDEYHRSKTQIIAAMDVAMGGRAAEELHLGRDNITGGASSDLEDATARATAMVEKFGMSEKVGLRVVQRGYEGQTTVSPSFADSIDAEINTMLNDSYTRALSILKSHRKELDMVAKALLKYETLDRDEIQAIIEGKGHLIKPSSSNTLKTSTRGRDAVIPGATVKQPLVQTQ